MDGTLTLEAGRIRKMKVLALGRWRYIQKLPHSAVSAINRDCQHHTEQVLAAYTTHLHRIFAQNNLRMDSAVEAQLLAASSNLLQATDVAGPVQNRQVELNEIVRPVQVHEREVECNDCDEPLKVVDILVEDCLEKMLSNADVVTQVLQPHVPTEGVLCEPRCGSAFASHPLFRGNPGAFCFQLYAGKSAPTHLPRPPA